MSTRYPWTIREAMIVDHRFVGTRGPIACALDSVDAGKVAEILSVQHAPAIFGPFTPRQSHGGCLSHGWYQHGKRQSPCLPCEDCKGTGERKGRECEACAGFGQYERVFPIECAVPGDEH